MIFIIATANAFNTSHLPIADKLKLTFPKLKASCFVIANLDCKIVIHEQNANQKIHTGTFDNIIFASKTLPNSSIKKYDNPFLGNNKLTLYEMNDVFYSVLIEKLYSPQIKQQNIKISILQSSMSGYGGVFYYESKHHGKYIGILYGNRTHEEVLKDIKAITSWLNQFYIKDVSNITSKIGEIPVLYGTEKVLKLNLQNQKLLFSETMSNKLQRICHYRTIIRAPIHEEDNIGSVFYFSDLFKNPITKPILSSKSIKKSNIFNCIFQTIHYIIFGSTN